MTVDVVRDLSRVVDSLSPEQNQVLEQCKSSYSADVESCSRQ